MAGEYCKECKFYLDNNAILGLCRRFPVYQNRSPQEWCGEFKGIAVAVTPEQSGDFLPKRMGRPKKMVSNAPFSDIEVAE